MKEQLMNMAGEFTWSFGKEFLLKLKLVILYGVIQTTAETTPSDLSTDLTRNGL